MKKIIAVLAAVAAAAGLRVLARRSNTQVHRINQH
ncbi:hypothetical protein BJY18_001367 [Amycolatopsis jiangsuensis]|uniref:Uncharacterized protein n=1 Tax=Amycolatopsis jiangsuensis TaxID=1181879 RepID=A0A840IRM7_9PSEU|nr:hypothetical protein [Amycolatopsis jiangsuensis]